MSSIDEKLGMSLDELIAKQKPQKHTRARSTGPVRRTRPFKRNTSKPASMEVETHKVHVKTPLPRTTLRPAVTKVNKEKSGRCIIKVSNIPFELTWQHIKDAFVSVGPVERCHVDNGMAIVVFQNPKDARQAIETYNDGVMNGRRIRVEYA